MELFGVNPTSISGPADLVKLPILSKTDVRLNSDNMFSRGFQKDQLHRAKTGGSTGRALDLYFTEECSELRNACARRHDCWAGWNPGEPIAACWGNPKYPKTIKDKLKFNLLQPYIYLDTMHVDEASIRKFLDQWRKIKPTLLYGHAHSIYQLAESIKKLEIDPPHPKGILSTSMMLIPSERKGIEAVFGLKVTDRYGCEEVSLIASECEKHHGMHLNTEHLVIEFLRDDGTPVAPGEPGRIVVTDLMNKAMPLIRYAVEDIGVPSDRICTCGRGLPLMEHVTGRVADFLLKTDGSKVAGVSLIENTLTAFTGIDQMQIIQEDLKRIILKIVPGIGYGPQEKKRLLDYLHYVFGLQVNIELEEVSTVFPEPSGKYRFSICKVTE
jgi:phenylacetate-CoA ligase